MLTPILSGWSSWMNLSLYCWISPRVTPPLEIRVKPFAFMASLISRLIKFIVRPFIPLCGAFSSVLSVKGHIFVLWLFIGFVRNQVLKKDHPNCNFWLNVQSFLVIWRAFVLCPWKQNSTVSVYRRSTSVRLSQWHCWLKLSTTVIKQNKMTGQNTMVSLRVTSSKTRNEFQLLVAKKSLCDSGHSPQQSKASVKFLWLSVHLSEEMMRKSISVNPQRAFCAHGSVPMSRMGSISCGLNSATDLCNHAPLSPIHDPQLNLHEHGTWVPV